MYIANFPCTRWSFEIDLFWNVLFQTFYYFWKHGHTRYPRTYCVDLIYIEFRFCETFIVRDSVIRIFLIETLYKFRTMKDWFFPYLHMYVLVKHKFRCFVYPTSLSCVSQFIDICTVAIKSIRNTHAVPLNKIGNISHFNDKGCYLCISHASCLDVTAQKWRFLVSIFSVK